MSDIESKRVGRWMLAVAWTGLIYSTLYIVRPICEFLKQYAGFSFFVNAGIIFFGISTVLVFVKTKRVCRRATYALLLLVMAVYSLGMAWLSIPEERLHFVEYGILVFLVYRALILDLKGWPVYLLAFLTTSLIGLGDEGIQYLLPNRHYQFKDVCLNSVSAALGLAFVYVLCRDHKANAGE